MTSTIDIAADFSPVPAGRFVSDGPYSGEAFRRNVLLPRMRGDSDLVIVLDGARGLPASFLEEAFGGLVREGFSPRSLRERLQFVTRTMRMKRYPSQIWGYIDKAGH